MQVLAAAALASSGSCPSSSLPVGGAYPVVQAHERSHQAVGRSIGAAACLRIHKWLAQYELLHTTLLPFVATPPGHSAFSSLMEASCGTWPSACEELDGMAAGAGLPDVKPLLVMSLRHELLALAENASALPAATECTDVHTYGAFAHNEDGDTLLKQTAFYVNASVAATDWHFTFRYPASTAGHAFGFNARGLALSMNAVSPRAIDVRGVGVYFLCHASMAQPTHAAVISLLNGSRSAYGGSLNAAGIGSLGGVNIEFGPGVGKTAVALMPSAPSANATFHMNEYLHLRDVPFKPDASSEHRLTRARWLVAQVPARAANLTSLWRVLGDTGDAAYPLYRTETAATATFELTRHGTLIVHENGNPLDPRTRVRRFSIGSSTQQGEDQAEKIYEPTTVARRGTGDRLDPLRASAPWSALGIGAYDDTPGSPPLGLQIETAAELLGPQGFVVLFLQPVLPLSEQPPLRKFAAKLAAAYNKSLRVIVRLGWRGGMRDLSDSSSNCTRYSTVASNIAAVVSGLPLPPASLRPLLVHAGNELNACNEWRCSAPAGRVLNLSTIAREVGGFMADTFAAMAALPGVRDGSIWLAHAAIANWQYDGCVCGTDEAVGAGRVGTVFLRELVSERPALYANARWLSSHSYPYSNANYSTDATSKAYRGLTYYRSERETIGVAADALPAAITETGWARHSQSNPVSDADQAEWLREAARELWLPDSSVLAVTPFLLGGRFWEAQGWPFVECSPPGNGTNPAVPCEAIASRKPVFQAWQSLGAARRAGQRL